MELSSNELGPPIRVRVSYAEMDHALDFVSGAPPSENQVYLSIETGKFFFFSPMVDFEPDFPDDIDDEALYIAIPHKHDFNLGQKLVLRFAALRIPDDLDRVDAMFSRKGAYRRFKDFLEERGALDSWYRFEEGAKRSALLEWCADNGIVVSDIPGPPPDSESNDSEHAHSGGTTPVSSPVPTYGLTHIALAVKNAQSAAEFYRRVFGCVAVYDQGGFVQVQTPGSRDVIVFDETAPRKGKPGGVAHFGFRLKDPGDIERAAAQVTAAGGKLKQKGEFCPGEPYLFATDLDGYEIEIWYEIPTSVDP